MLFGNNSSAEKIGEKTGYAAAYLFFTLILFFALMLLKKLPEGWTIFHVAVATLAVSIIGMLLKRILK